MSDQGPAEPCPNIADACCPPGDTCFSAACCPSGAEPCGEGHCYDPSDSSCCSDGTICQEGDHCVDGGCCPTGEERCGESHCYDPSDSTCCTNDEAISCKTGYECVPGGCCPSGQVPCGTTKCYDPDTQTCCEEGDDVWACPKSNKCCSTGFCYDPATEHCCADGACDDVDTCCEKECCHSIAYCAADGFCSACPGKTIVETSTFESTFSVTVTAVVTETAEESDVDEFTCPEMTITNSAGGLLELGDDCSLTYISPSSTPAPAPAPAQKTSSTSSLLLNGRQVSCTPYETVTSTQVITRVVTTVFTRTVTEVEEEEEPFTCPPVTVTNSAGAELILDESCGLEYSRDLHRQLRFFTLVVAVAAAAEEEEVVPLQPYRQARSSTFNWLELPFSSGLRFREWRRINDLTGYNEESVLALQRAPTRIYEHGKPRYIMTATDFRFDHSGPLFSRTGLRMNVMYAT